MINFNPILPLPAGNYYIRFRNAHFIKVMIKVTHHRITLWFLIFFWREKINYNKQQYSAFLLAWLCFCKRGRVIGVAETAKPQKKTLKTAKPQEKCLNTAKPQKMYSETAKSIFENIYWLLGITFSFSPSYNLCILHILQHNMVYRYHESTDDKIYHICMNTWWKS